MNKYAYVRISLMVLLLWLIGSLASPTFAQLPSGTILGVVKDSSGSVVPGATVILVNTETGLTRTATTGDDGAYRANALPVGHYDLKVEQPGFKVIAQRGLTLEVSQEAVVNFSLEIGSAAQEVEVTATAPLVNTTTSSLGGLVDENKMSELPLNGRNYIELTLLQPGVTQSVSVQQTSIGKGGTIYSSNGAPLRSNNYLLDGAQLQNLIGFTASSAAGTTLGVDGIREYKVVTSNFSAEYGMSMGSQTVMVSKGGSNQFHGDVFEFLRNGAMDARNFFDTTYQRTGKRVPQYQRNNFGGAFGGPIKKDKTFFFGVYEGLKENKGIPTLTTVPATGCHGAAGATITPALCPQIGAKPVTVAAAVAPLLALYPLPNSGATGFSFAPVQPTSVNYGQIRVDHDFSAADSFFTRYTIDNGYQLRPLAYPQFTEPWSSRDQYLTLSENHVFSPSLLNTARFSYSRTAYQSITVTPSSLIGPSVSFVPGFYVGTLTVSGLTQFSPGTTDPAVLTQNLLTLSDDLYFTKGKHALKFGSLLNRFQLPIVTNPQHAGVISTSGLAAFIGGTASNYSALFPGSIVNHMWDYYTVGFYAQDDWRLTQRLTINLGLRYEFDTTAEDSTGHQANIRNPLTDATATQGPLMHDDSFKNFSSRVGFAWDVTGKGKTSLRAGFGEYYDIAGLGAALANSVSSIYPYAALQSVVPPAGGTLPITIPLAFPAPNQRTFALQLVDYSSTQPHLLQWNVSVDQQLPGNFGLTVSYVGTRGIDLFSTQEGNPCTPTSITDGLPFWAAACGQGRPNGNWGSIALATTSGDSYYQGLQVSVNKRLRHGIEFQGSYTYSKVLDDTQSQVSSDGTGDRLYAPLGSYDKGPAAFDLTHNLRLNVLMHIPNIKSNNFAAKLLHGWWTGNIITVQSGYPFSPTEGALRDNSQNLASVPSNNYADRTSIVTSDNVAAIRACTYTYMGHAGGCNPNAVPFDPSTVVTGNINQWFNPNMFILQPAGFLGNAGRDILRGPGLVNWNFSLNKDTKLAILGENGSLQFRAEIFNILNHADFGLPNSVVYPGTISDVTEAPSVTAGQITSINPNTSPRDIQLGLKVIF